MKHTLLPLVWLSCFFIIAAQAQVRPYVRAGAGVSRAVGPFVSNEGGVLLNDYRGENIASAAQIGGGQWLLTGQAGIGVVLPVGKQFVIQAELNLEQKGSSMSITSASRGVICDSAACPVYAVGSIWVSS
jgi:hypothetical protein